MAVGDQIAQNFVDHKTLRELDFIRTAQFASIGLVIAGPATRSWYGMLDRCVGSTGRMVALKKVTYDQVFFAPLFLMVLISTIGMFQGHELKDLQRKLQEEYPEILLNNYKIWPVVQLLNFYFVPLQYQVLIVQSVAVGWNTYISYRTSLTKVKKEVDEVTKKSL